MTKMALASGNVIDPTLNDPVAKAVVDNIMGTLPTKKPLVRCDDCDLCFTSQTVLDAHLQGARHAKQIRSKVILATLEETKVAFSKDHDAEGLKCIVCNVNLNSIQQLQTHLNGNRHKKKAMKGGKNGTDDPEEGIKKPRASSPSPPDDTLIEDIPLACEACNKSFNSKAQYDSHYASKRHSLMVNGAAPKSSKKKRFHPYRKKGKSEGPTLKDVPSLSKNFISAGYVNN